MVRYLIKCQHGNGAEKSGAKGLVPESRHGEQEDDGENEEA